MQPSHLNFTQQRSIFDPHMARKLTVIGLGSVGGFVVSNAVKKGVTDVTGIDHDDVASHNVPMSIYRQMLDIGRFKAEALADIIMEQSGIEIKTVVAPYVDQPLKGSVICCVDDMDVRKAIWKRVRGNVNIDVFIDTRVEREHVTVYALDPMKEAQTANYEVLLFPQSEAHLATCGDHGDISVSQMAASIAVKCLTQAWKYGTKERHFSMLVSALKQLPGIDDEEGERDE